MKLEAKIVLAIAGVLTAPLFVGWCASPPTAAQTPVTNSSTIISSPPAGGH